MIEITFDSSGVRTNANPASELQIEILRDTVVVTPGQVQLVDAADAIISRAVDAILANVGQVTSQSTEPVIVYQSLDEAIATVDEYGGVASVSEGVATIVVRTALQAKRRGFYANPAITGETADTLDSFKSGTLGEALTTAVDSRLLSGKTTQVYSSKNYASGVYIRNPGCWAAGIDLTGVPVSRNSGPYYPGALISPCHLLGAVHTGSFVGQEFEFVLADNSVVSRTVVSQVDPAPKTDLRVCKLNADVPAGVAFCKIFPANVRDYLVTLLSVPVIAMTQDKLATVQDWWIQWTATDGVEYVNHRFPTNAMRLAFNTPTRGGDSGSPVLAVLGNELVLLGTHYGATSCAPTYHYADEINAAMATLGGGYQLTEIDLSSFTSFA